MIELRKRVDRRLFLASGVALAAPLRAAAKEQLYRFKTPYCDVTLRVEFHDRYRSRGFWFGDTTTGRSFCLSAGGAANRDCMAHFIGSLAIAQYDIRCRSKQHRVSVLREHVRNIDRDERLEPRPPFDRRLELQSGRASDIQAFGYEERGTPPPLTVSPWCYYRQDLYLEPEPRPFLIIHWKHELIAIRVLDIIPGDGTSVISP